MARTRRTAAGTGRRLGISAAALGVLGGAVDGAAARAGLLAPVLSLMRPRLERQLAERCQELAPTNDPELRASLRQPCRELARPASACLIRQTSASGRELGVLHELIEGRIGDDAEVVIKICAAELLGLPAGSLQDVPLERLVQRSRP